MIKKRYKIAVIGTGVAGCAAAYYLHKDHDLTVFEANEYIGGHVNTVDVLDEGSRLSIDTGFIVFNDKTYPNFLSLMDEIGQQYQDSVMSFSVVNKLKNIEYSGSTINGLFSQRRNIFSLSFIRMILDILRFNRTKRDQFQSLESLSVKEFLEMNNYSRQFSEDYLLPMASSIWSAEQKEILSMPIKFLHNFFHNHGLCQIKNRPQWKVIQGGSREYIKKLSSVYQEKIKLNTTIRSIIRNKDSITIRINGYAPEDFDYVFIATHSDQAMAMLEDPTQCEQEVLSAIKYQENTAILHTDISLMPSYKRAWAAWNYHLGETTKTRVNLTYSMNILQSLKSNTQYFVSLNSGNIIKPECIIRVIKYHHPVFNRAAILAQVRHEEINSGNRTFYCGAYWRNGFHEDGLVSAQRAISHFKERINQ
tara:strand:- start:10985 stop:12247 length:1263 start_codon:yes stop_codon:yes gene_type:complete